MNLALSVLWKSSVIASMRRRGSFWGNWLTGNQRDPLGGDGSVHLESEGEIYVRLKSVLSRDIQEHGHEEEGDMLVNGIINPAINSLISRVRHTNTLLIADRGFPYLPNAETVDISLVSGIPLVVDVLRAIRMNCSYGKGVMAAEFREVNSPETLRSYEEVLTGVSITWETHALLKTRVPGVIGIIRTGDATRFGNILLESS